MTSLGETYEGRDGVKKRPKRLYLGVGLFLAGSLLVVVAILAATTSLFSAVGLDVYGSRKLAGITAGLGVPAVFVGIFAVLPATSKRVRAAAAIGSSISVLGVGMFWYAYPLHWAQHGEHLTFPVVAVYFLGLVVTFWCLFTAVVNFKTRNDPGGTVTMEVTRKGETKVVEVERSRGFGSIGVFGDQPDGEIGAASDPMSDGGATNDDITSPISPQRERPPETTATATDTYCGNCAHFDYVRTDDGMTPYCGLYDRRMTDMDACDRWTPNR
jgi:MFS family permease